MDSEKRAFWAQVFSDNHLALRGFLRRKVPRAWDIQDLAQEAYLRILRVDERRSGPIIDPAAYLFTVAANLVKEHAVSHRRDAMGVSDDDVLAALEAPQGSAEDEAEREYRRRRVTTVLASLPPRCRAVLVMQHRDGMSYQEIAERLGVSTHMVKKYVVRALLLCRNELANKD